MPSTSGSLAVNASTYSDAGSNPPLAQIFEASGVPGNGFGAQGPQVALPSTDDADVPFLRTGGTAPAAIRHAVKEDAARFRHIDRLGEGEGRRILHHPPRIAGRELNVGDDGIVGIFGIELAEEV